jgi:hypothetical protein
MVILSAKLNFERGCKYINIPENVDLHQEALLCVQTHLRKYPAVLESTERKLQEAIKCSFYVYPAVFDIGSGP